MELIQRLEAATSNDVSIGEISRNDKQLRKVTSALDRFANQQNPDDDPGFLQRLDDLSEVSLDTLSQKVINRRRRISCFWFALVWKHDKYVPEADMWNIAVVTMYLLKFLPLMVLMMKPARGHTSIRSSTLQSAWQTIIMLICQHCIDPITREKRGFKLLTDTGLFIKLKKQMNGLINQYKLERSPRVKLFFGREHLHAILNCMLTTTEKDGPGRLVAVQAALRFLLTFYTTCRPSTGGWTEAKWAKAGRYPTLGHIKVYRRGYMNFEIHFRLDNFKGNIGTVNAAVQDIVLRSVLYAHNAFLDIVNWFMVFLYALDAFEKKYQSPQELFADQSSELRIDPAMVHLPLFREAHVGGRGFKDPIKPASADSATKQFGYWCMRAGFPRQGLYSLRREAGNMYAVQLGRRVCRTIMNHEEGMGVFERNYARGLADIELTSVRLGEIAGSKESHPGEALEKSRQRHLFADVLVESLIRFKGKSVKEIKRENRAQRVLKVQADLDVMDIDINIQNLWDEYRRCFTLEASNYNICSKRNVDRIFSIAISDKRQIKVRRGALKKAQELRDTLHKAFGERSTVSRKVNRLADLEEDRRMTRSFFNDALTGTTEERDQVMEDLRGEPSAHAKKIVQRFANNDEDEDDEEDDEEEDDQNYDSDDTEDSDDDDDEEEMPSVQMLEEYRENRQPPEEDPCVYRGNVEEWDKNLRREMQLEIMDMEEEEDRELLPKEFTFVERLAEARAREEGISTTIEDDDEEDTAPIAADAKDLDESLETDVLGLDVGEVRRIFFEHILQPITWEKTLRITGDDGSKEYPCELCAWSEKQYVAPCPAKYTRHKNMHHSPWKDLELDMHEMGYKNLVCPYGGCLHEAKSVRSMTNHMLLKDEYGDDRCPNAKEWRRMKAAHDAALPADNRKAKRAQKRAQAEARKKNIIPPTNEDLAGIQSLFAFGVDDDETNKEKANGGEWTTTIDWKSLHGNVEFSNMDFEKFRSEPMDVDEKVNIYRF